MTFQARQAARKTMNRRRFLGKAAIGVGAAAGAVGAGTTIARGVQRHLAQKRADLTARQKAFQQKGIKNPGKWAELSRIYKLDPVSIKAHENFVSRINFVSEKTGVSPESVLLTIEGNEISRSQIDELRQNVKIRREKLSAGEIQRLERVQSVISEVLNIPEAEREAILKKIQSTRGSSSAVKRMVERSGN